MIVIGDDAFEEAVNLPIELQNDGILDFGEESAVCWCWIDDVMVRITGDSIGISHG